MSATSVRMLGADFISLMRDHLPKDYEVEDIRLRILGGDPQEDWEKIPDDARVSILSGWLVPAEGEEIRLKDYARRWLKEHTTETLVIRVRRGAKESVAQKIENHPDVVRIWRTANSN